MADQPRDLSQHRPCVGVMLTNADGLIFIGERSDAPGAWQMPQGGIDKGEDVVSAALRELKEETGTDKAEVLRVTGGWLAYDFPPNHGLGKWVGQKQRWVLARFTGEDSDIDLTADDHQEFITWRWATAEEVLSLIVEFKRPVYEAAIAELLG
ncbi:MAG: RNA pyrophosphohydrolase [Alphaproteobacteria bacterium]|nr:RNA pyrophosphohydrolase [Alphaproteobacteria bacterium SS10]